MLHRRQLLTALGASALGITSARVLAAPRAQDVRFLLVFLRGGYDCASLLVPTASSFYYEVRPNIAIGDSLRVKVEGVDEPFEATVRSIASESSFTPYFALTGEDASRLVYRAELVLKGEAARRLPAGLPVQAERMSHEQ